MLHRVNFIFAILLCVSLQLRAQDRPSYLDPSQPIEKRIDDLLPRLTVEEKVSLCHAGSIFAVPGVPRLGIPELVMDDGPMGVREDVLEGFRAANRTDDYSTAMPATLGLAATWNEELANAYGAVIGQEAKARGKNVMLGPSLNIQRTPLCGRNFEYLGEDPYLTSRIAVNYIKGEQAQGVASCAKHFAANNQETQRNSINVEMDERTLREIYLPAFKAVVQEGGALTIMGAYNKFRGQFCCQNDYLLNKILKGEWGFKGLVMSDWSGVHDTAEAALNGMDMEMGTRPPYERNFLANPFLEGLQSGKFPMAVLDDKVRRHLYVLFQLHMMDGPTTQRGGSINTPEHQATARKVEEEAIVLLKNNNDLLPLDPAKVKSIAVIGDNATIKFAHSGGAAVIKAFYEVTPLDGIISRAGRAVNVTYSLGYSQPAPGRGGGRGRGGQPATQPNAPTVPNMELSTRALAAAKAADVVIFFAGLNHNNNYDAEGADRRDLKLTSGQDELISQIAQVNPNTIVVLVSGGAIEMPWLDKVPTVLQAWYPGMEGGNAIARVLFGDVNPSGKLPCTFPKQLADSPAHALNAYPGENGTVKYEEGLLVGYRWFDTKKIEPLFPFGHGLSYTKFEYSNLKLLPGNEPGKPLTVQFDIANTGPRDGAEVAQVYVQDVQSTLPRPVKELKAFRKIMLKAGEKQTVSISLDQNAFSYYDPDKGGWLAEAGDFVIHVGSSSRDIRLKDNFNLAATIFNK